MEAYLTFENIDEFANLVGEFVGQPMIYFECLQSEVVEPKLQFLIVKSVAVTTKDGYRIAIIVTSDGVMTLSAKINGSQSAHDPFVSIKGNTIKIRKLTPYRVPVWSIFVRERKE